MKKAIILLLSVAIFQATFAQKGTTTTKTIVTDGITRSYIIYIPSIYNGSTAVPLLLNFHGLGSNASSQLTYSNFQPIADTANFIMVLPEGLVRFGTTGWNCFGDPDPNIDDLRFVSHLIDTIKANYNINSNRIYSTGFSNGGFMSHDLAGLMSNRLAAIASVSGTMMVDRLPSYIPRHPTPVMHIHGTTDNVVSYSGLGTSIYSTHVDSIIMYWVRYNNCTRPGTDDVMPNINTADNCTAEHYVYSGGRGGSSVELYKIIGGGHAWPGSPYNTTQGNTNRDFSASIVIWNFLRQYDKTMDIENFQADQEQITIYPNPASQAFTLETREEIAGTTFIISDLVGKQIASGKVSGRTTDVNVSKLTPGIYLLRLNLSNSKTIKVVIR